MATPPAGGALGALALIAALSAAPALAAQSADGEEGLAVFRVRFAGPPNSELAGEVLRVLREAERESRGRLGFGPPGPLTVVLESDAALQETGLPEWADGLYDGNIRVPAGGLERPTERLVTVLRHELAHKFIDARTGGNCPAWLQEGLSQWLEGDAPNREDERMARLARERRLPALLTLEAPFVGRADDEVPLAYAASLSAAAHILRTRGVPGVVRLLESLGAGLPTEEALPDALGMSYRQLQESWDEHLASLSGRAAETAAQ